MRDLKSSTAVFVGNLLATKSMTVTAAVVLACTFMPIAGGAPKPYEVRELGAGVVALMNGETSTPSLGRVVHPDWGGVEFTAAVETGVRMTNAAFIPEAAAAEVEELTGEMRREPEILPVTHYFEPRVESCLEDCTIEEPAVEDTMRVEPPPIPEVDELAPLESG
ncbi:MAG: hypothetical protein AB7H66_14805 [Hyphomonadaceae bacterium]